MTNAELSEILDELRTLGTDHQTVEAKRARNQLPGTALDSLIAFSMADGGILLLGVDENNGAFDVTGVEDPNGVASALQSACAEVEPPLRPRISLIEHEPGVIVIAAELAATPRSQRPSYRRQDGPYNGSFVRVGNADERLRQPEVDEMLAAKTSTDHSARPGPDGATVDDEQVEAFVGQLRADGYRVPDAPQELLTRWQAIADGRPTLAGLLALGADPAAFTPAARLAYRVEPGEKAVGRKRFEGAAHIEGRIGEIIEATLARLAGDLDTSQVVGRDGQVYDELDVPAEALREIIANALLHRSLTEAQSASSVVVTVNPLAVTVQSPGGLHVATDLSELGLSPLSQVRNLTLVRLCQYLRTPRGARIVENQASGIRAADEACRQAGTLPALFFDFPARFDVVLIRHPIDVAAARAALAETALAGDADAERLLSAAFRLDELIAEIPGQRLSKIAFDGAFAARVLARGAAREDAAVLLRNLQDAGLLTRLHSRLTPAWRIAPSRVETDETPSAVEPTATSEPRRRSSRDRVDDLLLALAGAPGGTMGAAEIRQALGVSSPRSSSKWINRGLEKNLIEPTTDREFDPTREYRLTSTGAARVDRLQSA